MKTIILTILSTLLCFVLFADVTSTTTGGNWNALGTWLGGVVPVADDNVIINGTVMVNTTASCQNLTVNSTGSLMNYSANNYSLSVSGNINNAGIIRNSPASGYFYLHSGGNVVNSGTFIPYLLDFNGATDQYITSTGTFSASVITDGNAASALIMLTDLSLVNSNVNLSNALLILNGGSATSDLSMSGGSLKNAIIQGGNGATLTLLNNNLLENVSGDEIVLDGEIMVAGGVVFDSVINNGEIFNYSSYNYTFTINESLENHGVIRNHVSSGYLYLNLLGNLSDYGTISNNTLSFSNTLLRTLWQDQAADPISSVSVKSTTTGDLRLISDLRFSASDINLNSNTLMMYNGSTSYGLSHSGGKLRNGTLDTDGYSTLTLAAGVFVENLNAEDIILYGNVLFGPNSSFDSLVNHATIQNNPVYNYTLTINTLLENRGIIQNHPSSSFFYIDLLGDLYDYGTISNRILFFSNTVQRVLWQDPAANPISSYTVQSLATGDLQLHSDLRFSGSDINLNGNTLMMYNGSTSYGISHSGGKLRNGILDTDGYSTLTLAAGVFIENLQAGDIILQGIALFSADCSFDSLKNYGTIQNYSSYNYTLTINTRLENHSIIKNNPSGGYFYLMLAGDLYDYGTITNNTLSFSNTVQRVLWQDPAADAISSLNVTSTSTGALQTLSDLRFSGANINLNDNSLLLYDGETPFGLFLSGGKLYNATLATNGFSTLNMSDGAYIYDLNGGDIIFEGVVMAAANTSFDRITNSATIQNYSASTYSMTINTRFENHGITKNNAGGGYFYLNLLGDLYNYGTMANRNLRFSNTAQSVLWQDHAADPISCYTVESLSTGDFLVLSDLSFSGSFIDFNGNTLMLYNGRSNYGISLSGGKLADAVLDTAGFSTLNMSDGAYLANLDAEDIIFQGEASIANDCSFDDVVNYGTIRNHSSSSYYLVTNGNLVNYGTIRNHPSGGYLYLKSRKDLTNYGTIQNYMVYIDGSIDQYIINTDTISVTTFQLVSEIGSAQWFFNGLLSGPGSATYKNIDPSIHGVWQARTTEINGRYITIGNGATNLSEPANLSIYLNLGEMKLRWDQVDDAIYYMVYTSPTPDGTFSLLEKVFDNDLGDGHVLTTLADIDTVRFYKVIAGN